MASIDDRIVQMQFDNSAFERKLSTTLSSIEKLNSTIANAGAKNGLDKVAQSSKKFDLSSMHTSIDGVSKKFLAMSTIGVTALATVASKAITAGASMLKSLTLDPIIAGFKEYELNIGSIQTILANTSADGTNLEQVNAALDQLNEYSDKTIYNFGEMTKNIGTFTAAGVDLDTSVQSIKGIANLAAISGANSQQASSAMYQLSQAIASGSVKLMDWNSIVNAGMGGEVFQKALFETGKTMGTIADTPIDTTFEEWTAAGNTFRGSLEKGWLTSEVLTTTLQGFTGEMTEAQLMAKGFTKSQAQEMMRLGELGVESATKVRTLTQLFGTLKESVASGWSRSFRTIFGDFREATKLFTEVSNALGKIVGSSADARNELLDGWKELGGRTVLIEGLKNAFKALGEIMAPIKEAFREVFPPATAKSLFNLTKSFRDFAVGLRPSEKTVDNLKRIFKGLFSALEIGWTIIKETAKFIGNLFSSMTGAGSGKFLAFAANIGDFFTKLNKGLVKGKGIQDFFKTLGYRVGKTAELFKDKAADIIDFFKELGDSPGMKKAGDSVSLLKDRFGGLSRIFERLGDFWAPFKKALEAIGGFLDTVWEGIKDWFGELGEKLAKVMKPGDFKAVLDVLNVGILGGILVVLRKFMKGGINLNFGGGIMDKVGDSLKSLTGILSAMQADLRAKALLKIAGAIAILTGSLLVLSLINSDDLTRALTAMAVGFGQLIGAFALMNAIGIGPKTALQFTILSTGFIAISIAMLILTAAVKALSTMSWEELAKGLAGVVVLLGALAIAAGPLSKGSAGMIRVGAGMIGIAIALNLLVFAVKGFAKMDWGELAKGFAGVGAGLLLIAAGMQLMPPNMFIQSAGLILIAVALRILGEAVEKFSEFNWTEMGKGLAGMAGSLLAIAGAMHLMPATLPITAVGLLLVSGALLIIAEALKSFAGMDWGEIGKGLVAMGGALLILAAGTTAMSGAIGGAIALGIASASLLLLVEVLKQVGSIDIGVLIQGLVGLAALFAVLGVSASLMTPVIPALLGLGAAMLVLGAGFALFGLGVQGVAKGFEIIAKSGKAGVEVIMAFIDALLKRLPELLAAFAKGVIKLAKIFLKAAPVIVKGLGVVVEHILDTLIKLIPKAVDAVVLLIKEILAGIRDTFPDFVKTGFDMLIALLTGIRDNIGEIVTLVVEIVTEFLDALGKKIPELIDSVFNFLMDVIEGVVAKLVDVGQKLLPIGLKLVSGMMKGIGEAWPAVVDWFKALPGKIVEWVGKLGSILLPKGAQLIRGLFNGIKNLIPIVTTFFLKLPGRILKWIGGVLKTLAPKGKDLIQGMLNGINNIIGKVTDFFKKLPGNIFKWIGNTIKTIAPRGKDLITGFRDAIVNFTQNNIIPWFQNLPGKIFGWIGNTIKTLASRGKDLMDGFKTAAVNFVTNQLVPWLQGLASRIPGWIGGLLGTLLQKGLDLMAGFLNGVATGFVVVSSWLWGLGSRIVGAIPDLSGILWDIGASIIQGLWDGMKSVWESVLDWLGGIGDVIPDWKGPPEKDAVLLVENGMLIMQGLQNGMETQWGKVEKWIKKLDPSESVRRDIADKMRKVLSGMADNLTDLENLNPTITPVLDLTEFSKKAATISSLLPNGSISADVSLLQARLIARTSRPNEEVNPAFNNGPTEVKFEQIINAPRQLSTSDIYKQTRNQIAMAKEELSIP